MVVACSFARPQESWRLGRFDFLRGALSAVALVRWLAPGDGDAGTALAIIEDAVAAAPTVAKRCRHPSSEGGTVWIFAATSALITLLTVDEARFAQYGFPAYLLVLSLTLLCLGGRSRVAATPPTDRSP